MNFSQSSQLNMLRLRDTHIGSHTIRETVAANSNFSQSFAVTPILAASCQKRGLALDGKLKHEDTNLASSTM
ncbi:arsenicals resistance [Saguinus oedipus]|uniref:Arrestin-C n=1 Tax=Saguinus oedipus TaxID=9490 RepID=A0ABQ9TF50_SAGOE|nr:arsenicals resistance [Saguinus oedipus]